MRVHLARIAIVALFLSPVALAQPLADRLPADAILYAGWHGVGKAAPGFENSRLKAVLDESGIPQVFDQVLPALAQRIGEKERTAAKDLELLSALASALWKNPCALYVGPMKFEAGKDPLPRISVLCSAGQEAGKLADSLRAALAKGRGGPVPVTVELAGELVIVSIGEDAVSPRNRAGAKVTPPLSESPDFKAALNHVHRSPVFAAYLDAESLWRQIDLAVDAKGDPQAKEGWAKLLPALGLNGVKRAICTAGFDGRDWSSAAFVSAPAPRSGLVAACLDYSPISDQLLKLVPKSATMLSAGKLDIGRIVAELREVVGRIDRNAQSQLDELIKQVVNPALGMDLQKDLLAGFGDEWAVYASPTVGGKGLLGLTLVHRLADAARAGKALDALASQANLMMAAQTKDQVTVAFRQAKAGGVTMHYLAVPLITPAWAIKDGVLYAGLYPQTVQAAIEAAGGKEGSILDNEAFQAVARRVRTAQMTGIQFYDLPQTFADAYPMVLMFSRLVMGLADMAGAQTPAMVLPPLNRLLPHLAPAGGASWVDDAGWHYKGLSPFPGAKMVGSAQSAIVGQQAVLVSILLPALNNARQAAKRAQCASNLRQIGMGLIMYAADNKGVLPPDLATLVTGSYLSGAQVFACPTGQTSVPAALQAAKPDEVAQWVKQSKDYIYVGAGRKQAAVGAQDMLVHERLDNHGGDGINILFGDGHVEWHTAASARELIQKQTQK